MSEFNWAKFKERYPLIWDKHFGENHRVTYGGDLVDASGKLLKGTGPLLSHLPLLREAFDYLEVKIEAGEDVSPEIVVGNTFIDDGRKRVLLGRFEEIINGLVDRAADVAEFEYNDNVAAAKRIITSALQARRDLFDFRRDITNEKRAINERKANIRKTKKARQQDNE